MDAQARRFHRQGHHRRSSQVDEISGALLRAIVVGTLAAFAIILVLEKGWNLLDFWGAPITLKEQTHVAAILEQPEQYLRRTVRVEGTISEICPERGCWFELTEGDQRILVHLLLSGRRLTIRPDSLGKVAVVQGTVYQSPEKLTFIVPNGIRFR